MGDTILRVDDIQKFYGNKGNLTKAINKLCTGVLYDKHGQPHVCIDEYMKRHLEIKLISSIVTRAETV